MRCLVLGSLCVEKPDGTAIIPSGMSQRRLISVLCLHANSPVASSVLEEHLGLSAGAVRTAISRLRAVVEQGSLLNTAGYELRTAVDIDEFERALSGAFDARPDQALHRILPALDLWRGPPFGEFGDEPWAIVESHRLSELRATATEEAAALLMGCGQDGRARVLLEPLLAEHPYRDRPRALLMLAFASAGNQTEALRCFQDYRRVLLEEVGTEPSPELAALDRSIASGHPETPRWLVRPHLALDGSLTGQPVRVEPMRVGNLPVPLTAFVGRSVELAMLLELCHSHRLLTLTGPGGIGKTRLAIRACEVLHESDFADAVWVELGSLTDPREVAECVARALGIAGGNDPVGETARRLIDSDRSVLVLDNAEHLVDSVNDLVGELLRQCPLLRVLVTSRRALGRSGEAVYRVPPLSYNSDLSHQGEEAPKSDPVRCFDAVAFFIDRARAAHGSFALDGEALNDVTAICSMLDGVPLAIELAAARTRLLPLDEVLRSIAEFGPWPDLPTGSPTPRQATLNASIRWSLQLVDEGDQRLLSSLAVFRTPFGVDHARAVAPVELAPSGLDASLGRLVDACLLRLDEINRRFEMLQSVRSYLENDDAHADLSTARERHATYYARWSTDVGNGVHGIDRGPVITEMPEVTAASEWARRNAPDLAIEICVGLASIRVTLGYNADVFATWSWLLDFERERRDSRWANAVAALMSWATSHRLDTGPVVGDLEALLSADAARPRAWLERGLTVVPAYEGNLGPILAYTDVVHVRQDDLEESVYAGFAAYMLANSGRLDESDRQLVRLRRLTRRHGTTFGVDSVGNGYAAAIVNDIVRGDLASAARRGSAPVPHDAAFSMTSAAALAEVAVLTHDEATLDTAQLWSRRGTIPLLDFLVTLIAAYRAILGADVELAADLAEEFAEQARNVPVSFVHSWPLLNSALLCAGRYTEARAITASTEDLLSRMDPSPYLQAATLLGRAQIQHHDGDPRLGPTASRLLELATQCGFKLRIVDARDLLGHQSASVVGACLPAEATGPQRQRLGYHHRMVPDGSASLT